MQINFVPIPKVDDLLQSLSDDALVDMYSKALKQMKETDQSQPHESILESYVDAFAKSNACCRELKRRGKEDLLTEFIKALDGKDRSI